MRASVRCDSCVASHVIYSDHAVGNKNGQTKKQQEDVERSFENGHFCGSAINNVAGFYAKRQLICGDNIES